MSRLVFDFPAEAGCLLVVGRVSAYYNQTYGSYYTFILSNVSADNSRGKTPLTNAQDWCGSNGYTLAEIPNKEVQNYIEQFISSVISNTLMADRDLIILNGKLYTTLPGTWIWVNGQQIIAGVNIQDQQDPSQRFYYGFLKTTDNKIYASTHNNGRPFICEKPGNASDCAGGLSVNGRCYQRKTKELSWYTARDECLDGGGDLASFETLTDSTFNSALGSSLLANASATEYWVGIQRAEWRWEGSGHVIKYTNWEGGSPSNDKAFLSLRMTGSSSWLWYNYDCPCRFICQAIRTTVMATIPTSSTVSKDTPSASTDSVLPKPASPTSSTAVPNTNVLPLALGLGIGLGMGAILVVAIILGVLFIRRRQKSKSNLYSEPTSSSDASIRNDLKESDIDTGYEEMKNNGPNGNANQGAIYAAVQPRATLLPPTKDADTHEKQIVYADFDLVQKP